MCSAAWHTALSFCTWCPAHPRPTCRPPPTLADDEDEQRRGNGSWRNSREVELMERSSSGASTSYADDRLRRRGRPGEGEGSGEPGGALPAAATGRREGMVGRAGQRAG